MCSLRVLPNWDSARARAGAVQLSAVYVLQLQPDHGTLEAHVWCHASHHRYSRCIPAHSGPISPKRGAAQFASSSVFQCIDTSIKFHKKRNRNTKRNRIPFRTCSTRFPARGIEGNLDGEFNAGIVSIALDRL